MPDGLLQPGKLPQKSLHRHCQHRRLHKAHPAQAAALPQLCQQEAEGQHQHEADSQPGQAAAQSLPPASLPQAVCRHIQLCLRPRPAACGKKLLPASLQIQQPVAVGAILRCQCQLLTLPQPGDPCHCQPAPEGQPAAQGRKASQAVEHSCCQHRQQQAHQQRRHTPQVEAPPFLRRPVQPVQEASLILPAAAPEWQQARKIEEQAAADPGGKGKCRSMPYIPFTIAEQGSQYAKGTHPGNGQCQGIELRLQGGCRYQVCRQPQQGDGGEGR